MNARPDPLRTFDRLFPSDLPDGTVNQMFIFLSHLTDTFFQVYHDQLMRIVQQEERERLRPPDIDDGDFDDEIPM